MLHPDIDTNKCIGSSACVRACPEQAIRLVSSTAVLVEPNHSIGHGACEAAGPVEAIQPVFGTEKCGIDLLFVTPIVGSNVSGIFVAGELGGMALIRKGGRSGSAGERVYSGKMERQ
jgi:thioredoxin reductase (NADPH)